MNKQFAGSTALVAGPMKGVGELVAEALADVGVQVVISGSSMTDALRTIATIHQAGGVASYIPAERTAEATTARVHAATTAAGGHIDILVTTTDSTPSVRGQAARLTDTVGLAMARRGEGTMIDVSAAPDPVHPDSSSGWTIQRTTTIYRTPFGASLVGVGNPDSILRRTPGSVDPATANCPPDEAGVTTAAHVAGDVVRLAFEALVRRSTRGEDRTIARHPGDIRPPVNLARSAAAGTPSHL
jgi:hypothetical protein